MGLGEQVGYGQGKCLVQPVERMEVGLGEQVGYRKGKCLVQSVERLVSPRGFVEEEGACVLEKVVAGILLAF